MSNPSTPSSVDEFVDDGTKDTTILPKSCPVCNATLSATAVFCSKCGMILEAEDTVVVESDDQAALRHTHSIGSATADNQTNLTFIVNGAELKVPLTDSIIVGRKAPNDEHPPGVDLNPYEAKACGVSRQHVRISYRNKLIYVYDLGSTNGTWLNGMRVPPHGERLLRSEDTLQLGSLSIKVIF